MIPDFVTRFFGSFGPSKPRRRLCPEGVVPLRWPWEYEPSGTFPIPLVVRRLLANDSFGRMERETIAQLLTAYMAHCHHYRKLHDNCVAFVDRWRSAEQGNPSQTVATTNIVLVGPTNHGLLVVPPECLPGWAEGPLPVVVRSYAYRGSVVLEVKLEAPDKVTL